MKLDPKRRHRLTQVVVTIGTITCAAIALLAPHMAEAAVVTNVVATMVWLWE